MTSLATPTATRRLWPRIGWTLLAIGAVFAAQHAVAFMTIGGDPQFRERFLAAPLAGWVHTMGGALAILIGPFQLLPGTRMRWPRAHAVLGRVYVIAIASSALAGLYFAQSSVGGAGARVGFSCLAVCWLATVALAYVAIRRRETHRHRRWMIRSYALTFAAATLRVQLVLLLLGGLSIPAAIAVVAWTSWIPNALAVELWLRRDATPRPMRTPPRP